MMKHSTTQRLLAPLAAGLAALVAACSSPAPQEAPAPAAVAPTQPPVADAAVVAAARPQAARPSTAADARAYRTDAATHVYGLNQERVWKGRLPPMLYAIGVLQVEVDARGDVRRLHWMRAPRHAPEVIAEIEKTVRAAAPFPVPARMGKVVWTDTWLWDKSGKFQLDTLTEGQD